MSVTLLRALFGLQLAHRLYRSGARFALGREPWMFIVPRWDRGTAAPDSDELRRARQLALPPDTFLPTVPVDYHADLADIGPHHVRPQSGARPHRSEV